MNKPKILVLEEVAEILRRSPKTISKDISANPDRVPPWFKLPGGKTPMWYEHKVFEWLDAVSGNDIRPTRGRGRPRNQVA